MQPKLSIIIPVLNEAPVLPAILEDIRNCRENLPFEVECIVVDGGSNDDSQVICRDSDVSCISSARGRGQQLATGAEHARGEVFLFLHADSRLTPAHCLCATETLERNGCIAGGFRLKFDHSHPILRFAELVNLLRFRMTKIFYGDHGIFLRRTNYFRTGGIPRVALFEDIEFSRRLKRLGSVVMVTMPLITSARRFRGGGIVRTYLKMATLHILHWLRVSPDLLARWYGMQSRKFMRT